MTNINPLYLLPVFLIGGLIAFFFGRRIVGGIRSWFARRQDPAPAKIDHGLFFAVAPMTAAERARDAKRLRELQAEEVLRKHEAALQAEAREREVEAILQKISAPAITLPNGAGPLTTAIKMTEDVQAMLKAAAAARDAKAAASPNA